ncbi:MATE family efflux transporter [Legionella cincinnatiensis]|uniref:Multidrug-efflux transporter n=1 Tax=Legionella cincinnatiensis TaxID=28085 RepID=A0A378IKD2_9GAMM|nr:MATE family efflux transporter [Legionella cincinnatiensis]KTC83450.1 MATE efflux family protein [Legionella cincinnatiensis]STX35536.1 MATE efflux family protein [Legionella cincinnatiensis]
MDKPIIPHSILTEIKANLLLSLPLMAAWFIHSLGPFAGTAMIAHLGKDALAGSVLVGTIWMAGITFWFGLFHAVSILIPQQMGANNNEAISEIMGQALLLNFFSWIPMMGLLWMIPFLVHWSARNLEVLMYAAEYAHALIYAVPGVITLAIIGHFLAGIGKTKMSLCISLIEIPLEIVFIYIFVFGKLGIPAFGIAGVGYGLAFSFTLTSIFIFIYLYGAKFAKPFQIFKHIGTFNWAPCKEMLRIGLPIGFTYFIELVGFTVVTYFVSRFNNIALAAHQIILQFEGVIVNIPHSISQAITVRVGIQVGRMDKTGVIYASYVGIILGFLISLVIFLILVLFPMKMLSIDFNIHEHANIVQIVIPLFFTLGVFQVFDSIRVLEAGALRGLKDTKFTMYVNIFCFSILGVFLAYLMGIVLNHNVQGIWYGLTFGMILGAIILFFRLKKTIKNADLSHLLKIY